MNRPFIGALLAFVALPGMVAFLVPLLVVDPGKPFDNMWGVVPLTVGFVVLLFCVREFYVAGRGTLAPWSPPRNLVTTGLYQLSRNPMYIGVVMILSGWAVGFTSWRLAVYASVVTIGFHLRVLLHEEPWAARTFGPEWELYRSRVPRWMRLRAR
jgi:protein-S-isoprenylcysteine O-methyltransferase Ste14